MLKNPEIRLQLPNFIIEKPELMSLSPFDIHSENDELSHALHKFWDTESLRVRDEPPVSQLDGDEFVKNIHFDEKEGRYEVRLPWKEGQFPASNEYELCVTRLRQLQSTLYIREGKSQSEKSSNKVYICLFTCASTS